MTPVTAFENATSPLDAAHGAIAPRAGLASARRPALSLEIFNDPAAIESEWRRFEQIADCTAFQTFDWLALWHLHVGPRQRARPAVVVARFGDGEIAFIAPLCVIPKWGARRLCWLGQDLCDYNGPLLAPDFAKRIGPNEFMAAWRAMQRQIRYDPLLRFDWIEFEKMPQKIGTQNNPFMRLAVAPNPNGAHLTQLSASWEEFYTARRSSATRRRDRTKRRHMSGHGDVRFATAHDADDSRRTLEILMEQKGRTFARKGIADIFDRPGYRDFFLAAATGPNLRHLIHVSRVDVGDTCAAANFGIVFGDCYYHVLASYGDGGAVSQYGPGALHLRELMAYAIGLGLKRFDFTIGDEPYKLEWSDTYVALYDFAAGTTWRGLPAAWWSSARRRIKRFIKQTPALWRLASAARAAIGARSRPRQPPQ